LSNKEKKDALQLFFMFVAYKIILSHDWYKVNNIYLYTAEYYVSQTATYT